MTVTADSPIAIFDSGVGGLTVARAIMDQLPGERIRYVGDTVNCPYGPLPIAEARKNWENAGWEAAADGMALVTSIMRAHQVLLARVDTALAPFRLSFARYEVLMLLSFSQTGRLPLGKIGQRLQVQRRVAGGRSLPGIDDDVLGAAGPALVEVLHGRRHGVGGVAAHQDDDVGRGDVLQREVRVVDEQDHQVGVLLQRTGLAEVGQHRPLVGALLRTAVELRERHHRDFELLGQQLELAGELRDLQLPGLDLLA